jgi:hypothetical protein
MGIDDELPQQRVPDTRVCRREDYEFVDMHDVDVVLSRMPEWKRRVLERFADRGSDAEAWKIYRKSVGLSRRLLDNILCDFQRDLQDRGLI